ncbi:MAG TPA: BadF/BadG/BcrA/BcrD ATPase family protein, partial [Vicinamibacteria bacterium]|nr:BadF/BadG/BcrA/BcrD ATPase family protein [Vicinamibacteria bacterium]
MKCAIGIDLGSTTTKAVVMGLDGKVMGRGITNSRSNYDVACQVALSEALINARFSLVAAELSSRGVAETIQAPLLEDLERGIRMQQYLAQLRVLRSVIERLAKERGASPALASSASELLSRMEEETPTLYRRGASRKSDFFRDLAGSRYLRLAEKAAPKLNLPF